MFFFRFDNVSPRPQISNAVTIPEVAVANATQTASNTYDYIVVGSGPGGGPLARVSLRLVTPFSFSMPGKITELIASYKFPSLKLLRLNTLL